MSILAIDLGSSKTLVVLAEPETGAGAKVMAIGEAPSAGVRRGLVADIEQAAASITAALRKAKQMAEGLDGEVLLSVSGEHIQGHSSKGIVPIVPTGRTITRDDVKRVVNHSKQIALPADRTLIHAIAKSFRVDGQDGVTRPQGMSGERLEVSTHLVTGQTTHIHNMERAFQRANLDIEDLCVSALASGLAIVSEDEKRSGVAVIDIGAGVTDVGVFVDGAIAYTCVLPVGGHHVSSDISQLLKTTLDEAESLKVDHGSVLPETISEDETVVVKQVGTIGARGFSKRILSEIIRARANEVLRLAKLRIEEAGLLGRISSGVLLTGGGAKLKGLPALASEAFDGAEARLASPTPLGLLGDMLNGPEHSTAVGLVRYAIQLHDQQVQAPQTGDGKGIFDKLRTLLGTSRSQH